MSDLTDSMARHPAYRARLSVVPPIVPDHLVQVERRSDGMSLTCHTCQWSRQLLLPPGQHTHYDHDLYAALCSEAQALKAHHEEQA